MLLQQQKMQLSAYSGLYDLIIPQENLLRKINELIDFSFIYEELLSKYCLSNGRNAESPVRMFKYHLLKSIYTVSDVDVVERSRYDMSFKYFLEMTSEEDVINPSSLTKFRKLRLKDTDLLNLLIGKTVTVAIEKGIIKSKSIITRTGFKQTLSHYQAKNCKGCRYGEDATNLKQTGALKEIITWKTRKKLSDTYCKVKKA